MLPGVFTFPPGSWRLCTHVVEGCLSELPYSHKTHNYVRVGTRRVTIKRCWLHQLKLSQSPNASKLNFSNYTQLHKFSIFSGNICVFGMFSVKIGVFSIFPQNLNIFHKYCVLKVGIFTLFSHFSKIINNFLGFHYPCSKRVHHLK